MKFYTSYFYAVRFFDKSIIPMSTAKWDFIFLDKNNVVNGFRIKPFMPGPFCDGYCGPNCGDRPSSCAFIRAYRQQLFALDKDDILRRFEKFAEKYKTNFNVQGDVSFALLVHEAPENKCSERSVIREWFSANNIPCEEFQVPRKKRI